MENLPDQTSEKESFQQYLEAIKLLEEKYRRGEITLKSLLYAYDQMQAKFHQKLNPGGDKYNEVYKAAVTDEGNHYTELKAVAVEPLTVTPTRQQTLNDLLERIGSSLHRAVIEEAIVRVNNPNLTDEEYRNLLGDLLNIAFQKFNENFTP